jgi:hypothetical protein
MPNVTVYLPDDQHAYLRAHGLRPSEMLQDAVRALQLAPLEEKFREEWRKYRNDPERRAEWERDSDEQFVPCQVCGTAEDPVEGCMAMFDPYKAAAVALLAHYPDDMRRANLQYWEKSGFKDVTLGMPG